MSSGISGRPRPQEVLTLREVAALLSCGYSTAYRLTKSRELPAFHLGSVWRFLRADLERWIANMTAQQKYLLWRKGRPKRRTL